MAGFEQRFGGRLNGLANGEYVTCEAEQRGELPEAATLASLGCGNPIAVAELSSISARVAASM